MSNEQKHQSITDLHNELWGLASNYISDLNNTDVNAFYWYFETVWVLEEILLEQIEGYAAAGKG